MSFNTRLLESIEIVAGCPLNSDMNTTDVTSDIVSLKNYDGCLILIQKPDGTAGDDIVIALKQQTNVSAGSVKALNIKTVYTKIGTMSAVTGWTRYDLTTPGSFDTVSVTGTSYTGEGTVGVAEAATDLASDVDDSLFLIDVRASDMDVSGGFDCLSVFLEADEVAQALLVNITFILYGARYPSRIPKTAITN